MAKRWIIRSLFTLPIVLCLAGWGWSGWYQGGIVYARDHRGIILATMDGAVCLRGGWLPWEGHGYAGEVHRNDPVGFWPESDADETCFLGFRWRHYSFTDPRGAVCTVYGLTIPYWAPLLIFSLLLLLFWRKTRRRADPATAFPVVLRGGGDAPGAGQLHVA